MSLLEDVSSLLEKMNAESFADETERRRVKDGLHKAFRKASTPFEVIQDHLNWYFSEIAIVRALIFAGVFQHWARSGSNSLTCHELARMTGADVVLLS